jgi:single-strand DNA-binding protein
MAKGTINKVIVLGRIGVQPEVRYMPSGMAVMSLSIATNDGYKDKNTGQFVDQTEWHRVSIFGKQAETIGTYVKKGDLLYVEGRIKTSKYQDRNTGEDRYSTEIVAIQTQMIGGKSEGGNAPLPDYIPDHVPMSSGTENFARPSTEAKVNEDANAYARAKGKSIPQAPSANTKPDLTAMSDDELDMPPF